MFPVDDTVAAAFFIARWEKCKGEVKSLEGGSMGPTATER